MKATLNKVLGFIRKRPRLRAALVVGVVAGVFLLWRRGGDPGSNGATFAARRGPLDISVLEGGSLQALESQEVKCEVRVGYQGSKILKIVDEGYLVTEDDVLSGKVLVELDSSEIEKLMVQQEIQFQSASASLIDGQQNYDIQLNQNLSDIKAAEQKARFSRMDFDKFLGDSVTREVARELGLDAQLAAASTNAIVVPVLATNIPAFTTPSDLLRIAAMAGGSPLPPPVATEGSLTKTKGAGAGQPVEVEVADPALDEAAQKRLAIDFSRFARLDVLGDGEAKQKLRKLEDDLLVAQKELGQAQATLEGTRRLAEKGFVTRIELQRDEIANEMSGLKVKGAETARSLFLKYEFVKSAEEFLSKLSEAVRELNRARKAAVSRLAQAEARLKSAQAQYSVQLRQRNDFQQQMGKCVIKATKPGLVVYGGSRDDGMYYGDQERIREGATVRERQAIITIPNLTHMSVNVKIHESYIKKVRKGLKAVISIDAFPDKSLNGEVTKVGVLPDSQNRWMNPDMKVYLTQITIEGSHDWVKPGMSAKVEIKVEHLDDVIFVPIQAVTPEQGKHYCHVVRGFTSERRPVDIGQFNDDFIEIKRGLEAGELVLLRPPEAGDTDRGPAPKPPEAGKEKPERKSAPPPAPAPTTAAPNGRA